MCDTSEECVRRCLDGRPDAYRALVRQCETPLHRYLSVRLGSENEAVEAAQETFVRAYFSLNRLRKPEFFFAWLLGIARRVASETLRDRRRRRALESDSLDSIEEKTDAVRCETPALEPAVNRLPEKYRQVIILRFYGGMSCAEVGRQLNLSLGTVTKRLSRAYSMLRESLGEEVGRPDVEVPR